MTEEEKKEIIEAIHEFHKDLYLNAEPPVDLDTATEEIDCNKHCLKESRFIELLKELTDKFPDYVKEIENDCCMWELCRGPKLIY